MNDLISWLRQQLDTDERERHAHCPGCEGDIGECGADEADARTARQVQAHRAILDEHPPTEGWAHGPGAKFELGVVCRTCAGVACCDDLDGDAYPCRTLRLLVSIYSDRDGYKEEWSA